MPTFGSLFAGVGGFDLGFEAAGWEPRWQVEWDARCRSVLERHWPQVARYGDVRDVRDPEPVDLITYGFPCQDLSVAGRRAGLDGNRSGLFFEATRIIKEMRDDSGGRYPTWAVAENVCGLLNADRGAAMGRCLDALAGIGAVDIEWGVLDAQYFGVPQRRRRVFIVAGFRAGALGAGPLLPLAESSSGDHRSSDSAREGASGDAAPRASGVGGVGGSETTYVKTIRSGARDRDGNLPAEVWAAQSTSPTLIAFDNGSESRSTVLTTATTGVRRLTPRECERLQGFPDDWTARDADGKPVADTVRYRMMGNAVAVPVAAWVARRIADCADSAGRLERP